MTSHPAAQATVVTVQLPRRGSSLGIASIILGILAFLICWIPFVGILSLPLSGLGLLLGLIGFLIAVLRKGSSIGLPIAGSVVCILALVVTLTITTAMVKGIKAIDQSQQRANATNQQPVSPALPSVDDVVAAALKAATTAPADSASPTATATPPFPTAVTSSTSAPLLPPPAQPASKPAVEWASAETPVKQGDVQIRVIGARFGKVPLKSSFGDGSVSKDPLLSITVEITNISKTKKLDYLSFAGSPMASFSRDYATLADNFDNSYKRINFGLSSQPLGRAGAESIYPGKALSDVLVFEPPLENADYLNLELPATNFGGEGMIRLRIAKSMIKMADPPEAAK